VTDSDLQVLETAWRYCQQGRYGDAEAIYRSVLSRDPANHWARLALAASLKTLRRLDEAALQYEEVIAADPSIAVAYNNLGNIYKDLSRHGDAEQCFLKALDLDPGSALAPQNLGGVYAELGRQDEAIAMFRRAIRIKPDYAKAYHHLAFTKKHDRIDDEVRAMEILYRNPEISFGDKCHLAFGLGKAYDDIAQYPKAFSYFAEGNRLKHQIDSYPLTHALDLIDAMRSMPFNPAPDCTSTDVPEGITPVFLVGMPRSGTSLTEQVLASHSMVYAAGELPTIGELIVGSVRDFPRGLAQVDDREWRQRGRTYLDHVRRLSNGSAVVVDKMPGNFLYLGIIHKMLPHARILHCKRNPLNTCLSCFKSYFVDPTLGYTSDLVELGTYYLRYLLLMEHWHQLMPGRICDTRYEDLVDDPEATIGRLLDACGLPFEEDCARFRGSKGVVATASAMQVRQPIHSKSVQAWRRHAGELQPLISLLGEQLGT
jgi:tetratricopeptide (TPR) repeat protein